MAILRFGITKSDKEWALIEKIIAEKYKDKKVAVRGKGFNQFIANEIYKKFKKPQHSTPFTIKITRVRKTFMFKVQDDVMENITLAANELGIDEATLITNVIVNPHLEIIKGICP